MMLDQSRPRVRARRRPRAGAASAPAATTPTSTPGDARLEGARGRGPPVGGRLAPRGEMGARHGAARRGVPHRQVDPDLRARRTAPFRRHQHVPQGALCRERPRRRQVRRGGARHPVRFRHHLPPRHPLRAAGHPPHLGALHALQLRARRRPPRADDALRRRRRLHHPGQPREELRPDHAAASPRLLLGRAAA